MPLFPAFSPKNWQNGPGGGTPISESALEEMETRVATHGLPIFTEPGDPAPDPEDYEEGQIWIEVWE